MDDKMHALTDSIISGWLDDIKEVPHPLHPYWQHCESLTVENGLVFHGEALIIPQSEREKFLGTLHQSHQGITKTQLLAHGCVFWPDINKAIEKAVWQCETCMRFQAQNAATPLTPAPSHPWQICASDIFTLHSVDYLILAEFYSKVILVCNLPAGQSYSAKVIHILEEWFYDHGMPEVLCTDNGPQYASAAFADCSIEWDFTHETWSPHYPQSNRFAESCVKIVKHTLQHAKYSGTNPRITLQHLKVSPVDAKLPSSSLILYSHKICTTIPSRICNTDPAALQFQEHLEDWAKHSKSYADKCSKWYVAFYASQPIATFDTLRKIWISTTVVCVLPKNNYQVHTANGTIYHHTRCHLWECNVKCSDV